MYIYVHVQRICWSNHFVLNESLITLKLLEIRYRIQPIGVRLLQVIINMSTHNDVNGWLLILLDGL